MVIKVCGMREAENIRDVEKLGIDLMGFIFWPKSSRYVSQPPAYLPTRCKRVGVFVDASTDEIIQKIHDFSLDITQLHGNESPEQIRLLRERAASPRPFKGRGAARRGGVSIIKAFNIATSDDFAQTTAYDGLVDYFLFDTKGPSVCGNGEKFYWDVLRAYDGTTPFLLSGGIGPDDAEAIISFHHPKCVGIDLNSRFELSPALKDVNKLKKFIKQVRL